MNVLCAAIPEKLGLSLQNGLSKKKTKFETTRENDRTTLSHSVTSICLTLLSRCPPFELITLFADGMWLMLETDETLESLRFTVRITRT